MKSIGLLLLAAAIPAITWKLPEGLSVKDNGPRTYRFTVDYIYSKTNGEISRRERVMGDYTRGLPQAEVRWQNVTVAQGAGPEGPFAPPEKQNYMEGFRYSSSAGYDSLKPEFFKAFPPTAMQERNLVWDVQMIEAFGQKHFEDLRLNQPYRVASSQDLNLAGAGKFQNRDVELVWTGMSQRNRQDCAHIAYRAYFNRLEITGPGMNLKGRSHYWGEIWVSTTTKQVEYATLYEDVLGELKLPQQDSPTVINVFRNGTFEPVAPN